MYKIKGQVFDSFELYFQTLSHINMNELEKIMNVSRGTFSKVYKKQRHLSIENKLKLINFFDLDFSNFENAVYPHGNRVESLKKQKEMFPKLS